MSETPSYQKKCPGCGQVLNIRQTSCSACGHQFNDTPAAQTPRFQHIEDRSFLEKNPWVKYLGLFLIVGLFFSLMILASGELISNTESYIIEIAWLTQAISGGVIALLIGCIQLFIFRQNLKQKFYLWFLSCSLLSGVVAGGLVGYLIHLQILSYLAGDAFFVGLAMGAFSGCLSAIAQGLFIFNKKAQTYKNALYKWVGYHIISWSVIWGVGWAISWRSSTTESLALAFAAIMILSGILFTAFLQFAGNIDYAS